LAVAQLYVDLTEVQRWGLVDVLAFECEPVCWRGYSGTYGVPLVIKPDAYLRLGVGDYEHSWFVEQDMASEAPVTIKNKARRYIDYYRAGTEQTTRGVFPRVVWIVPDEARATLITEVLATLSARPALFAVSVVGETVSLLTTEAGS
jgi:hypothetical protein